MNKKTISKIINDTAIEYNFKIKKKMSLRHVRMINSKFFKGMKEEMSK